MSDETAANPHNLQSELEQARLSSARLLEAFAQKLGAASARMPFGRGAADTFERAARYVQGHSVRDMAAGMGRTVRRHPAPSIAVAVVAGFLVGRAIRSR